MIISALLLSGTASVAESIYDGSGSLVSPTEPCWGCGKDAAIMQPHSDVGKKSTVTFQWLQKNDCHHIDIHASQDLGHNVEIGVKAWQEDIITETYSARLPEGNYLEQENGVSITANNAWTTFSITSGEPLDEAVYIYAYCRSSIDALNTENITQISTRYTYLSKDYTYIGNASLISSAFNGENGRYGTLRDVFVTSSVFNTEGVFQILSSDSCQKVTISDEGGSTEVAEILIKGWSEEKWKATDCASLPCTLNLYKLPDGRDSYTLVSVKTKKNTNNQISAICDSTPRTIAIKEKELKPIHPHNCKFSDVSTHDSKYEYITALCSAQIIEGYGSSYTEFGKNRIVNWAELTKVVNLSENFYKTKKITNRAIYDNLDLEEWYMPYIDIAKDQGFDKSYDLEVTQGVAYQYIVKIFWNKYTSTESQASIFLRDKGIIASLDTSTLMKRGYMAEVVLKSSRISADENGFERKLPYVNHPPKGVSPTHE